MISDQEGNDETIVICHFIPPTDDTRKIQPVTISQILEAISSEDHPLVMEGKDVSLVAHVTNVEIIPGRASFMLEDGTGKICAQKNLVSLIHELGSEAEEEEIAQYKAFEHTYTEVLGILKKNNSRWWPKIQVWAIHPVHGYHQVMYHILNVIHSNMLSQQCNQPHDSNQDIGSSEDMDVDDSQANQDNTSNQHPIIYASSASHPILPNTFSPQKHQPYATLKPLEKAIMKYMHHHRNHVLIAELAQTIQVSCGCTEFQFNDAFQALLSEAYLTSPLDDGYVVVTPRH